MDQHQGPVDKLERSGAVPQRKGVLVFVPEAVQETRLSFRTLRQSFWADRYIHIIVFVACVSIAGVLAFLPRPVYRAQAVLLPVSNSPQSQLTAGLQAGGLASLAGLAGINLDAMDDFRKESNALLTSRDFTVQFIEEENLLPILYPASGSGSLLGWLHAGKPRERTIDDALERFDHSIRSVSEDRRNGLTMVSIDWTDRFLAAKWANALVARANAEMRRRTMQNSQKSIEFLKRELTTTTATELQSTLYRLMEADLRKNMLAAVREDYAFRVIDTARVPMKNRYVRPQRGLILGVGLAFALVISAVIARVRAHRIVAENEARKRGAISHDPDGTKVFE